MPVASLEFRRIDALPRRVWQDASDLPALADGLTKMLKTPSGTMELQLTQAAALRDLHDHGGVFGPIVVGGGKTLITLLAPTLLQAKRPLLLVPAALRDQTLFHVIPAMRKHWKLHTGLWVVGYSELSLLKNANILENLQPDLILADECHMLANLKSGRTRRVTRYMRGHPMTRFVALSGTISNHSIMNYWHTIQWALKPANSPLPAGHREAEDWALAVDERVKEEHRRPPGALLRWAPPDETVDETTIARRGYRRRLVETPGVIATSEDELGVSLQLLGVPHLDIGQRLRTMMRYVKEDWETPEGDIIMEAVQLWRVLRQLSCGFYYKWDPKPPREWLEARKAWNRFVRHTLQYNRRKLDTPLQVWNASPDVPERETWSAIKDTFKPRTVAVWVDFRIEEWVESWLCKPGIAWVEHPEMGRLLSANTGIPYFGAGDSRILTAKGPIIASIAAHGTGKNLQQWDRNLVVSPMTAGGKWEQLMGRTHRMGQLSDTVTYEVLQHTESFRRAMQQAFADARFLQDTHGNRQRLLYCDTTIPREERANGKGNPGF